MTYTFDSRLGELLYRLLPEVYRTRDRYESKTGGTEDLARYLDAHGHLLDLIHATLEQQLKDKLPETSQDWLLPYFAQLLAVNIVSPDPAGKHAEVAHAVSWRQGKGTLRVAEKIAEAVGQMEAEIQEGWKRVAMTPRIDMPVIPAGEIDSTLEIDKTVPSQAARHPSLPAVMADLRRPSRAVEEALATNPTSKVSHFGGEQLNWRHLNRHGAPCFPDSFDDVSRRTIDIRTPSANHGHYHHKRLLVYVSPPEGLIPLKPIELTWGQRNESRYEYLIKETVENGVKVIRNNTRRVVIITDDVRLDSNFYKIEGLNFSGMVEVSSGGKLELVRVEAGRVDVATHSIEEPVVTGTDSLIGELSAGGMVQLDSCTVRGKAYLTSIKAKDCILMDVNGSDISGVLEYTCYPAIAPFSKKDMTIEDCTMEEPSFFADQTALDARSVLAPDTPSSIYSGAGDGGEMGYFHHGREGRPVHISGYALHVPAYGAYLLRDVIFKGDVEVISGNLMLQRCVVSKLTVQTGLSTDDNGFEIPGLDARDCLFNEIIVAQSLARLEYCTVMHNIDCKHLQASDCIFAGSIKRETENINSLPESEIRDEPESGCVRYSRIPAGFDGSTLSVFSGHGSTNKTESPVFARFDYCNDGTHEHRVAAFGEPGYGVLDRSCPDAVRFGAEDGAEMGAHHHKYYSLKIEAVLDKMREFLPVDIEPVLIQDRRLLQLPPKIKNTSNGGSS